VKSALVRKLLAKYLASPCLLLLAQLLGPLDILPHALLLRHLAPTLNLGPLVRPGRGRLLVAHEPGELAQAPGFKGLFRRVIRVVDVGHEVRSLLCSRASAPRNGGNERGRGDQGQ
jgi:hypothetical protein